MLYSIESWRNKNQSVSLLPDNFCQVLINLGDPLDYQVIGSIRARTIERFEVVFSTCKSKGTIISGNETLHFYSAQIYPEYTRLLCDKIEIDRNAICSLGKHRIHNQKDFADFVKSKSKVEYALDPYLQKALRIIRESKGNIKIKEIYESLGVSKTFLEQRFSLNIGISAKEFCKVEKIKEFMANYLRYHKSLNLTQLTLKSGYYDQSHLIKDFRYFMDCTPKDFLKSYKETTQL